MFSRDQLKRAASLTEEDFVQLAKCRRPHNRLGFAYQVGFVRLFGRFPQQQPFELFEELVCFSAAQLGLDAGLIELYRKRQPTISEHQQTIAGYLRLRPFDDAEVWIRLPNGRALTGFAHEYKRHGTSTLFAALEVATGLVHAGHYRRRRRREFLDFMNELVAKNPDKEIHVVLDNLNTHKPKENRWLKTHPNVHFHFIPTHSSWLNQIECWFSILSRAALQGSSFTSVRMLVQTIEAFIASWNQNAAPFEWTKKEVHQQEMKRSYADLCNYVLASKSAQSRRAGCSFFGPLLKLTRRS